MIKHNTREQIHNGLSQKKEDQKWADLLNFRSSENRTFVIPRRFKMFERDAGFHTILHGLNNSCYALGSKSSWHFNSNDTTEFAFLWRARIEQKLTENSQADCLHIKGSYDGTIPRIIRVTVVKGKLILDTKVIPPVAPTPEEPIIIIPDFSCVTRPETQINVLFVNSANIPVPNVLVQVFQGRLLIFEGRSNPVGRITLASSLVPIVIKGTRADGLIVEKAIAPEVISTTLVFVNPWQAPTGVLEILYLWGVANGYSAFFDLDTKTQFLAGIVGFNHLNNTSWLEWTSGDNLEDGPERILFNPSLAFSSGVLSTPTATINCGADWYPPAGGSGNATMRVTYNGVIRTKVVLPGTGITPAQTPVATVVIQNDGTFTLT